MPPPSLVEQLAPHLEVEGVEEGERGERRYLLRARQPGDIELTRVASGDRRAEHWRLRVVEGPRAVGISPMEPSVAVGDRVVLIDDSGSGVEWAAREVAPGRPAPEATTPLREPPQLVEAARARAPQLEQPTRVAAGSSTEPIVRLEAAEPGEQSIHHFCAGSLTVVVLPDGAPATFEWRPRPREATPYRPTGRVELHRGDLLFVPLGSLDADNERVSCMDGL